MSKRERERARKREREREGEKEREKERACARAREREKIWRVDTCSQYPLVMSHVTRMNESCYTYE